MGETCDRILSQFVNSELEKKGDITMTNMFPAMKIIIVLTIFFCFAMLQASAYMLYNSTKIMTERKVERRREKCDDQVWIKQKIEVSSSIEKRGRLLHLYVSEDEEVE